MPELNDPHLGTAPEHRILYALQQTGSRLVGDRFFASYLAECLSIVNGLGPAHKFLLASEGQKLGVNPDIIKSQLAQADDNLRWVTEMMGEDFHRTNVLALLSAWAAHEAGSENVIAAILSTIHSAAVSAAGKFAPGKHDLKSWPWSDELCLELAQKLDQKAKDKTPDGGWDAAARLTTLYGWLGVTVKPTTFASAKFNETSLIRNVLLHRYGRLSPRDCERVPNLKDSPNKTVHLTRSRLSEYYQAIVDIHLAIANGIWANGWK